MVLLSAVAATCATTDPAVEFYAADGYRFTPAERQHIERIARLTVNEVRRALRTVPAVVTIRVQPSGRVIPETGEAGSIVPPAIVDWQVDPSRPEGVTAIASAHLRATLFHELHHLVRAQRVAGDGLIDRVVDEGLATAFERDFAGTRPLWGAYPSDVDVWAKELLSRPADARWDRAMVMHPDGRRWIGYKAGTYLVDRARHASGKSSAELVWMTASEVIALGR